MTTWPPRRILVPVDFSPPSQAALAYAVCLADEFDAALDVLHAGAPIPVIPTGVGVPSTTLVAAGGMTELLQERERVGRERLLGEVLPYVDDHDISLHWGDGDAAETIARMAESKDAHLVVMGTHGRSGVARALIGSVAERTLRLCDRPVLLVRSRGEEAMTAVFPPRRIVAPTDFSEAAEAGVEVAADLAKRFGATLELVHALPLVSGAPFGFDFAGEGIEGMVQGLLNLEAETLRDKGLSVNGHLLDASAASAIVRVAEETAADLVVLASHGRGGVKRLVLGSVAERSTRLAPCPVLVVRRGEETD